MSAVVTGLEYVSMDEVTHKAAERGTEDGTSAAGWVFDGNTDEESYRAAIKMDEDGDPEYFDYFDAPAPLSGEWADGLTPASLVDELGYTELTDEEVSEVADAYETAFNDAHRDEVLRIARVQLED